MKTISVKFIDQETGKPNGKNCMIDLDRFKGSFGINTDFSIFMVADGLKGGRCNLVNSLTDIAEQLEQAKELHILNESAMKL